MCVCMGEKLGLIRFPSGLYSYMESLHGPHEEMNSSDEAVLQPHANAGR